MITTLQSLPIELLWLSSMCISLLFIIVSHQFFGVLGVAMYIAFALIMANLQVLKMVQPVIVDHPIALGTILFTSIFFATDLISECHGIKIAKRMVLSAAGVYFLWILFTVITLGYAPLSSDRLSSDSTIDLDTLSWQNDVTTALSTLLTPAPAIFVASVTAFLLSQGLDITVFAWIKKLSGNKHLWLRNNVSTLVSTLLDNAIFSLLAFWVLADPPLPITTIIVSYIFGTWVLRIAMALIDTPFIYIGRWLWQRKNTESHGSVLEKS